MLEALCRPNVYDRCKMVTGHAPIVRRKGMIIHWDYEGFYGQQSEKYPVYEDGYVKRIMREPWHSPMRLSASLFRRKGEIICEGYIRDRFDGDWQKAIKQSGTFANLFSGFEDYFRERKEQFMKKTDEIIAKIPKQLTTVGEIKTCSHSGVANLLRTLTKTMHEQGSSIKTIAKVQYAICTQAGIYIPDEFITDVLVAADINPDVLVGE